MERIRGNDISMIFQEPMTSLNPLYTCGKQIAEAVALHQGLQQARRLGPRGRDAAPGLHPRARAAGARLSAPALGRHAPARHDRHGAVVQSQGADRRRADHGARRHHPGADPRPDARAAGDLRHRHHPDHPRHGRGRRERRPRGGDVCRPQGRGGRRRRAVRRSGPPLHQGPAGLDPASRHGRPQRHQARARLNEIKGMVPSLFNLPPGCSFAPRCAYATDQCRSRVAAARGASAQPLDRLLARRPRDGAAWRVPHDRPLLEVAGPEEALPDPQGRVLARCRATSMPSTACRSRSAAARRWGWWARAAAASRRSAARS